MLRAFPVSPARFAARALPALCVAFLFGCSDAPTPLEPGAGLRPNLTLAPVLTVTNTDDAGPGSLRQTLSDAEAVPGTTVQFDPSIAGQTIVLTSGEISIGSQLTLEGPATKGMTINGNVSSRVFKIVSNSDITLRNLSIVNSSGSAIFVAGKVTLDHVLVANNESTNSGAGLEVDVVGAATIINSTFSGNVTATTGGAIHSGGDLIIRNSTITGNAAGDAGGVWVYNGSVSLRNSIIANNIGTDPTTPATTNCVLKVAPLYAGHNISNDDTCGTDLVVDPLLGPLADNGGPTKTHAIGGPSPAIDGGTSCTEATDQRYVGRPQGGSCDLGAFEFNDYGTINVVIGPNVAVNAKTGVATVGGTVTCSKPTNLLVLRIEMSQTQKTTGRFTTIIQAIGSAAPASCGTSPVSWSVVLTPQTGKFTPGTATGTATTVIYPGNFLFATVTSDLKVFQVK